MKNIISTILILLQLNSFAQKIPVVNAIGGEGTNVDWVSIEQNYDSTGPGYFYNDCSDGVRPLKASSALTAQGTKKYSTENLTDGDPKTAWVEGVAGYGIGEWFEVLGPVNVIYNGYQSSPAVWKNNSRVKSFKVYANNSPVCLLNLTDEMGAQRFQLPVRNSWKYNDTIVYKFVIADVYKGLKYDDVGISEVDDVRCCLAFTTVIEEGAENIETISDVNINDKILCINLDSNTTFQSEVLLTTSQEHVNMITINTETKNITLTKDHPLNFKGYGFISISSLMTKLNYSDFQDLVNNVEILTWDENSKSTKYEKLTGIETLDGKFKTYSIRKISGGQYYIANGIITETY